MEMVAEGALEEGAEPGWCQVNDTFTALVEGKEVRERGEGVKGAGG
jgi:hypothetical protein